MPRLVTANCPRCGAALELAPGLEVVTCRYCGFKSMIEWASPRRPATAYPVAPLDPNVGRIVAQAPQAEMMRVALSWTLLVLVVLGAGIVQIVTGPTTSARPVAIPQPHIPISLDPVPGPTSTALKSGPRMVDGAELLQKARVLVASEMPDPKLSSALFFNVVGGMVNTTDSNVGSITFESRTVDPNAAAGKDIADMTIVVRVANGTMTSTKMNGLSIGDYPLEVPTCSSQSAWNAAVQSGVPSNAIATMAVESHGAFGTKSPTVWSIRVDGHDEYRREIDARTCAMVKNWGAPAGGIKKR